MRTNYLRIALISTASTPVTACSHAPSVEIVGSFFPIWMVSLTIAVVLTFFARKLLVRVKLESEVGPVALIYPSMVVSVSCLLWLLFFR